MISACPAGTPAPAGPTTLVRSLTAPDDLGFDGDGTLLFTDLTTGTLSAVRAGGSIDRLVGGLASPEGIVVEQDGTILVAEQGHNRVVAIDPSSHVVRVWRDFPNRTGGEGIDGIGPQLGNLDIVVPDSPNGVVWRVGFDGKTATRIATGMQRPVGAASRGSGAILVADEGGALWDLDPTRHRVARLPTPDDVVVDHAGHILVNTLGDNAIHELDAQGRAVAVFGGLSQPQGIALDAADNLYYTEFTGGRIGRLVRSFILGPPTVRHTGSGTSIICPVIRRAAGFNAPLNLLAPDAPTATRQLVQPGTGSSGALEIQTDATSIQLTVTGPGISLSQTVALSP